MFNGSMVALITPMRDGRIDETALRALVDWHVEEGTSAIVPCGTTGEAVTMTEQEWEQVVSIVIDQAAGRVPVVAGTGTNDTARTVEQTRRARDLGATAALVVTPYYNRPTQEGLYRHFTAIADMTDFPIVPYNVPSRTGTNMLPETVVRLAEHPRIVAVKESSGNPDQTGAIIAGAGDSIAVLSGDDSMTLPIMSLGGTGVISVAANVVPGPIARMTAAALAGDFAAARTIHYELIELMGALFVETNPVPAKTAAAWMGLCAGEFRLPLAPLSQASEQTLFRALRRCVHTASELATTNGNGNGADRARTETYARLGVS